jgi:hypothetical protein
VHSGPEIEKKLDKLITFFPMHIFSNPIQGKGKMTQRIRFWGQIPKKSLLKPSILPFRTKNEQKMINKNIVSCILLTLRLEILKNRIATGKKKMHFDFGVLEMHLKNA